MNEKGDICFRRSNLSIQPMQKAIYIFLSIACSVIWSSHQAHAQQSFTFEKIVDTDTQMPGGPGTFGGSIAFSAPSLDGPHLAFIGHNNGAHGYKAIYVVNNNNFFIVADTSTPMPNTGGLTFRDFNGGISFPLSISGSSVVFRGSNRASADTAGIYTFAQVVADFNTPIPNGSTNFVGRRFGGPAIDGGNVVFNGGNSEQEGIYTLVDGRYEVIADLDTIRPGTTENFDSLAPTTAGLGSVVDIEGEAVVFESGTRTAGTLGLYTNLGGPLRVVADQNTPIDFNFIAFDYAQIDGGDIIFHASHGSTTGIYMDRGGQISVLADSDTQIPGGTQTFGRIDGASHDSGRLAFVALISVSPDKYGLYTNIGGELIKVLDSDDMLDGKVPRFLWISREGLSGNKIGFKVQFADFSQGIYVAHHTPANEFPIADAGVDQAVRAGNEVFLDGSASFDDNTPSASLAYAWSFSSLPPGSNAILLLPDTAMPSFDVDVEGTYVVQLVVTDEAGLESLPDEVMVSSDNLAPTANAGIDQLVIVGSTVFLNGLGSTDPEDNSLTYSWMISSAPAGSTAALIGADTATPSFVTDLEGLYDVSLLVSDFIGPGTSDSVEIVAVSSEQLAVIEIVSAGETVVGLGPEQVTTQGNQNALMNFLTQATVAIQEGDLAEAINKLQKALSRTDGCVLRSAPDSNGPGRDWITDCTEQIAIYNSLNSALIVLTP